MAGRAFAWVACVALLLCLAVGAPSSPAPAAEKPAPRSIPVLQIEGAIGPATSDYVTHALADAAESGAPIVLIRMDTPGGLDTSMREIIRAIVNAPVPIVTYVAPSGARAASAGAFILMASHVAAMAPGTNVGAATPVQIGATNPFGGGEEQDKDKPDQSKPAEGRPASATDAKALNDAIAYIRSLAEMRGRNVDWAESAVRTAASLSAQAALEQNVIEIVARNTDELLDQLQGRTVRMAGGREVALDVRGASLVEVEPDWRIRLLAAITNPNVALILMMIGLYGLLFEFMNPGALYPGTIGAICLLVGLYALTALPVNYAGAALIVLGLGLMTAEAFVASFGILGIGGVIAFVLGAAILVDTDVPQFQVALPVLAAVAVASLAFTVLAVRMALSARRSQVVSGREQLIGTTAAILDWNGQVGHVRVHGERWSARSAASFSAGQQVRVVGIDGLTLLVEPPA